jgi:hypothetical protein
MKINFKIFYFHKRHVCAYTHSHTDIMLIVVCPISKINTENSTWNK